MKKIKQQRIQITPTEGSLNLFTNFQGLDIQEVPRK
jgi:hypothetical protein